MEINWGFFTVYMPFVLPFLHVGALQLSYSPHGGAFLQLFSPCDDVALPPPPTKISAGTHGYTLNPPDFCRVWRA